MRAYLDIALSRRRLPLGSLAAAAIGTLGPDAEAAPAATKGKRAPATLSGSDTLVVADGAHIHSKDWGAGQPVVFGHGWPLNGDAFEGRVAA